MDSVIALLETRLGRRRAFADELRAEIAQAMDDLGKLEAEVLRTDAALRELDAALAVLRKASDA